MNQIERDVFVLADAYKKPIDYVRFTNAIPIVFNFQDYDIPSGATANVYCAKPSGNAVYNPATISGNSVTVVVTDQMFIEPGKTIVQVRIENNNTTLVTFGWDVFVHENGTEGDIPSSQNEAGFFDQVQEAIDNANTAAESSDAAASSATQAASAANQAAETVQAGFDSIKAAVVSEIINDTTPSETNTFSSQHIADTYLEKDGDSSSTTVSYEQSTAETPPASESTLSEITGWEVGNILQNANNLLFAANAVPDGSGAAFGYNFLYVDTSNAKGVLNKTSFFDYNPSGGQSWTSVPDTFSQGQETKGIREVLFLQENEANSIIVKITEISPIYGRMHFNLYTSASWWSGWTSSRIYSKKVSSLTLQPGSTSAGIPTGTYGMAEILYCGYNGLRQHVITPVGNVNLPVYETYSSVGIIKCTKPGDGNIYIQNTSSIAVTIYSVTLFG